MNDHHGSDGYFTGADYTLNCYSDLNPLRASYALLVEGYDTLPDGPCCELGYGQGVSLAIHAAADATRRWWGTDFMPSHVRNARELLQAAGVQAEAADQSFADFCRRDDLPPFAFIALHGVWSWISPASRQAVVDFLRRKLMPGGAVFISYNTLAGWAALAPLRRLMVDHARWASAPGDSPAERARAAQAFSEKVFALDGGTVRSAPVLRTHWSEFERRPEYVLHEYMNRNWNPMSFTEITEQLEPAQLTWACSTDLLLRLTGIQLTPEQQAVLDGIAATPLRESVRDLFNGQRLRRDLWVRGARRLSSQEQRQRLYAQHVVLTAPPERLRQGIGGPCGEAQLPPERLDRIEQVLGAAAGPVRLGEVCRQMAAQGIESGETLGLVTTLIGSGAVHVAADPASTERARPATDRLNAYLMRRAASRGDIDFLASPVSGGGISARNSTQLVLAAARQAPDRPQDWAGIVWQQMQQAGQQLQKKGQVVTDREVALATLESAVQELREHSVPPLRRLQVV